MPRFEIRSGEAAHEVDAANWMAALGEGLGHFGLSQESLSKVICDLDEAGLITVKDPESGEASGRGPLPRRRPERWGCR